MFYFWLQAVGCDLKLGSPKKVDECGVCGGDGRCNGPPIYKWEALATGPCSLNCGGGKEIHIMPMPAKGLHITNKLNLQIAKSQTQSYFKSKLFFLLILYCTPTYFIWFYLQVNNQSKLYVRTAWQHGLSTISYATLLPSLIGIHKVAIFILASQSKFFSPRYESSTTFWSICP